MHHTKHTSPSFRCPIWSIGCNSSNLLYSTVVLIRLSSFTPIEWVKDTFEFSITPLSLRKWLFATITTQTRCDVWNFLPTPLTYPKHRTLRHVSIMRIFQNSVHCRKPSCATMARVLSVVSGAGNHRGPYGGDNVGVRGNTIDILHYTLKIVIVSNVPQNRDNRSPGLTKRGSSRRGLGHSP